MHPRFQAAFAQLAENVQSALAPILADEHFPALLTAEHVTALKEATGLDDDARWPSRCCRWRQPAPAPISLISTSVRLHAA